MAHGLGKGEQETENPIEEDTMRLISWNVNGIRAVSKKGFLEWFEAESPDVLCLQETKAHPEQLMEALTQPQGYTAHFASAEKKGYSGVVTYSKLKPKTTPTGLGIDKFDAEGRTLMSDFGDFVLFNVYFPNGKARAERLEYKMAFYEAFLKIVSDLKNQGRGVVICGDVNTAHKPIDLAHPKQNEKSSGFLPQERAWIDALIQAGFHDTLRLFTDAPEQYSWWDLRTRARARNVGWRIDYFFISDNLKDHIQSARILPEVQGSDHCPVEIELTF